MHASRVDLAPVLAALGLINNPPTANVFVPDPNHSHVLADGDINDPAIWWQVIPVLVLKQSDWPPQDGSSGITSVRGLASGREGRPSHSGALQFLPVLQLAHRMADMHMN